LGAGPDIIYTCSICYALDNFAIDLDYIAYYNIQNVNKGRCVIARTKETHYETRF